jgi:hypothetical protein
MPNKADKRFPILVTLRGMFGRDTTVWFAHKAVSKQR